MQHISPIWLPCTVMLVVLQAAATAGNDNLPEGFTSQQMMTKSTSLLKQNIHPSGDFPLQTAFLPDNRLLLMTKQGWIYIGDPSQVGMPMQLYLRLPDCFSEYEVGLLSILIEDDLTWPTSPYFYLYWGKKSSDKTSVDGMRVSKFRHLENEGGTTSRGALESEEELWVDTDGFPGASDSKYKVTGVLWHFGGALSWGPKGNLYLTLGDKHHPGWIERNDTYSGCIIRIGKDGSIPEGNLDKSIKPKECWAYGMRNPFRSHWDLLPINKERFIITEVGGNDDTRSMEDIHIGKPRQHMGWPHCEGDCGNSDFPTCDCAKHDNPLYSYKSHNDDGGGCVIGGGVYRNAQFPEKYIGTYFFADYVRQFIKYIEFTADGSQVVKQVHTFSETEYKPASLSFDRQGSLWIIELYKGDFRVNRISYVDGGTNSPPDIFKTAAKFTSGLAPMQVKFAANVFDEDLNAMEFSWYFGDGEQHHGSVDPLHCGSHTQCSEENGVCECDAMVRFGAQGEYAYLESADRVQCNSQVFGDPIPGVVKTCECGTFSCDAATTYHVYQSAGVYNAQLVVSDGLSTSWSSFVNVIVGVAPWISILTPSPTLMFEGGETVSLVAIAFDFIYGNLTDSINWDVEFAHNEHSHQLYSFVGATGWVVVPTTGHSFEGGTGFLIKASITNADGLEASETVRLQPRKVILTLDTTPTNLGVRITMDGYGRGLPLSVETMIKFNHDLEVPKKVCTDDGLHYVFVAWETSETTLSNASHFTKSVPSYDLVITASYELQRESDECTSSYFPDTADVKYLINCGGPSFTDEVGHQWSSDEAYISSGRTTDPMDNAANAHVILQSSTQYDRVYESERYSTEQQLIYSLKVVAGGTYTVRLLFVDFWNSQAGDRLFSASIGGTDLGTIDIAGATGRGSPLQKEITLTSGSDRLNITLERGLADNPTISGIMVWWSGQGPQPQPTPTPSPTPSPVVQLRCHWVTPGKTRFLDGLPPYCAENTEEHKVRCCSDSVSNPYPTGGWNKLGECSVWGASFKMAPGDEHVECRSAMTFSQAEAYCTSVQARLCTKAEMLAECTAKHGCGLRKQYIWTESTNSVVPPPNSATPAPTPAPTPSPTPMPMITTSDTTSSTPTPVTTMASSSVSASPLIEFPTPSPTTPNPSVSPTPTPTPSPLQVLASNCHWVAPGKTQFIDRLPPYCADNSEGHKVRCCSDSVSNPYPRGGMWNKLGECSVWGASYKMAPGDEHVECRSAMTFPQAQAYCMSVQARLCTKAEMLAECTAKNGCGFSKRYIWTQSSLL